MPARTIPSARADNPHHCAASALSHYTRCIASHAVEVMLYLTQLMRTTDGWCESGMSLSRPPSCRHCRLQSRLAVEPAMSPQSAPQPWSATTPVENGRGWERTRMSGKACFDLPMWMARRFRACIGSSCQRPWPLLSLSLLSSPFTFCVFSFVLLNPIGNH